jgi:uncharacterized protein (DUF1330 family)
LQPREELTKSSRKFAIALAAAIVLSAFVGKGSSAQSLPPTYFVVDFSEITDPEGFKALAAKATPEILAGFGGKYMVRSQNITAVEGVAPKRLVIIAFDTPEHAKAWAEQPEPRAIRAKTTKSRSFLVEGLGQP